MRQHTVFFDSTSYQSFSRFMWLRPFVASWTTPITRKTTTKIIIDKYTIRVRLFILFHLEFGLLSSATINWLVSVSLFFLSPEYLRDFTFDMNPFYLVFFKSLKFVKFISKHLFIPDLLCWIGTLFHHVFAYSLNQFCINLYLCDVGINVLSASILSFVLERCQYSFSLLLSNHLVSFFNNIFNK